MKMVDNIRMTWEHFQEMYNDDPHRKGYLNDVSVMILKIKYGRTLTTGEFKDRLAEVEEMIK